MSRWHSFIAADIHGKWIITDGYAEVIDGVNAGNFKATLRHAPDSGVYHYVDIHADDDSTVIADVSSPQEDVPSFSLRGAFYAGDQSASFILTDGTTILGLAWGSRSGEPNLA